jgi:uncharacterized protein YcbK (DUF882 family)
MARPRVSPPSLAALIAALLVMSVPLYAGAAEVVHVVGRGETLYWIAKRYHVSVDAIREVNDLPPRAQIHPGLSLVIPGQAKEARAGAAEATKAAKGAKGQARGAPAAAAQGHDRGKSVAAKGPAATARRGFIHLVRGSERLDTQLVARHGHLAPKALAGLQHLLRFYPTGAEQAIDPRLAALVGEVSDHFGGKTLHVVSGFRPYTPAQYTPHSNHNAGRAMDFSVEGVPNTVVRDFCRTFRSSGVGYYPNSTFVHLDVRTGKAYWIDYSHPGEAPHYDSASGRGSADEAAREVEPHGGAVDAEPGSSETQ